MIAENRHRHQQRSEMINVGVRQFVFVLSTEQDGSGAGLPYS